jgi:hypothetical protein
MNKPTVTFSTFCYHKDAPRIHQPGHLKKVVEYHNYPFDEVILVHQRLTQEQKDALPPIDLPNVKFIDSSYDDLKDFNIPLDDEISACCSTGNNSPHWWPHHVINHLAAIKASTSDYIVFSDSDISIIKNEAPGWVVKGIEILNANPDVLLVSPSEGGTDMWKPHHEGRFTMYMSQQIFLARKSDMLSMDWNVWWDWPKGAAWPHPRIGHPQGYLAPQQPFREFYPMAEGRIWRWMNKVKKYRFVLDQRWRYWHDGAANK